MSNRISIAGDDQPIDSAHDLTAYMATGEKPKSQWRIGTEHEKFVYRRRDLAPVSYDEPGGIRDILDGLGKFGWQPVHEGEHVIALVRGDASVSLEPGGQFELSGAPLSSVHETCAEVHEHLNQVKEVSDAFGVGFLGAGFQPIAKRDDIPVMPKGRYDVMRRYMPKVGSLGLDMMLRTTTIQVNLDFGSEADMVKKLRVGLALQPVATALFANSPFKEGKPNGFLSYRSQIWTDTDPDRTGILPFAFEDGMGFERYVDYALDVPMYFLYRDDRYVDVAGKSFRDFLAGKLPGFAGELPTIADWKDHLSTIFPEVRLKTFLEMRGADGGPWRNICALPAFWVGLLYDQSALDAAWDLVKHWSIADHQAVRLAVPRDGLRTRCPGGTLREVAIRTLEIAEAGLSARAAQGCVGATELGFLATLWEVAESGMSPADRLLASYHGAWQGDIRHIFDEQTY